MTKLQEQVPEISSLRTGRTSAWREARESGLKLNLSVGQAGLGANAKAAATADARAPSEILWVPGLISALHEGEVTVYLVPEGGRGRRLGMDGVNLGHLRRRSCSRKQGEQSLRVGPVGTVTSQEARPAAGRSRDLQDVKMIRPSAQQLPFPNRS